MADITGYLKTIRDGQSGETVRDAIINCMRDINEDGQVKKASLVITKPDNVTYKPGKGKAFSSVTVNITGGESNPNKTIHYETLTVTELTENGTYPTEEQPDTYYDKVEVAIDWDKVSHPSNLGEEAEMTTYETDENGNKYWDAQLAGFDYVKRIWIPNSIASGLPGGDYPGGGGGAGPFKVNFYDRLKSTGSAKLLTTVTVDKGGNAEILYTKEYPRVYGTFMMWDPPVKYVTKSIDTYAKYYTPSGNSPSDLGKTWDEILAMNGEELLGKYNRLEVVADDESSRVRLPGMLKLMSKTYSSPSEPQEYDELDVDVPTAKFTLRMQCVGVGENGSRTTWLSMQPLPADWILDTGESIHDNICHKTYYGTDDWASCWLHQIFEKSLLAGFPEAVRKNIVTVPKATWGAAQYPPISGANEFAQKSIGSSIWLPSIREVGDLFSDYDPEGGSGAVENDEPENAGLNYSYYWTPDMLTQNGGVMLRSLVRVTTTYGAFGLYNHINDSKTLLASNAEISSGNHLHIGFCLG
jgi:hypothetical protein